MSVPAVTDADRQRERATVEELAAAKRDLTDRIGRQIDFLLSAYAQSGTPLTPSEASDRARAPIAHDPLEQGAEHVSWHSIANLAEHEPERARDVWGAVKDAARLELRTGLRAARSLERMNASPYQRAQYLAILEGLRESLGPRGGAEEVLMQMRRRRSSSSSGGRRSRRAELMRRAGTASATCGGRSSGWASVSASAMRR